MEVMAEKFAEKISNAQDLIVAGDDLVLDTNSVVNEIESLPAYEFNLDLLPQILNLENMMSDVKYIRESLKENTDLAMKLLKTISGEIEFEPNAELLAEQNLVLPMFPELTQCEVDSVIDTVNRWGV